MSASPHAFNAEIFALLAVGLATVALRLWLRARTIVGFKGLASDDYLAVTAAVVYGTETALAYVAENEANGLTNSFLDGRTRATLASQTGGREYGQRVLGSKIEFGSWASHSVLIWSLKGAVCKLYFGLANTQHRQGRQAAFLGLALVAVSWLGATLTLLLSCRPITRMWQLSPNPGSYCQPASSPALIWTYTTLDATTYLYLLAVPLPFLVQTGAPARHKLMTVALLACGFLAGLAAVNRAVVVSSLRDIRLARKWGAREAFAALVTVNMATILRCWMGGSNHCQVDLTTPTSRGALHGHRMGGEGAAYEVQEVVGQTTAPDTKSGGGENGIQRRVEVCVREDDDMYLVKNGNYTGVWSGDQGGRQTRSRFFGDHIHQRAYPRA